MKLIWHAEKLWEAEWLRFLCGDVITDEVVDLDLNCFDDNSIHIVSINWRPLLEYEKYFRECRARCQNIILCHFSDEWYSGAYRLYAYFDGVIRNFHTYLATGDGILTIPEGYSGETQLDGSSIAADQRRYAWSFVGEIKASRIEMAAALDGLQPQLLTAVDSVSATGAKRLTKPEFDAVLRDTVFSPCPMGNVILETCRLYESLELGCIPLAEKRSGLDYFGDLFGPNPIPRFESWTEARLYAETAYADKAGLVAKQSEIRDWWSAHKVKVRNQVQALITGPSHAQDLRRYSGLLRNRVPPLHEALRLAELLRHQNAASLTRRLSRPVAPLKRILRESLHLAKR